MKFLNKIQRMCSQTLLNLSYQWYYFLLLYIYHDFLPPSMGVVMSNQIMPTRSSNTHTHTPLGPYTRYMRLDFKLCNLPQTHHVTASHHSIGDNPPERGKAVRKNTEPTKNTRVKLSSIHMHQGYYITIINCCSLVFLFLSIQFTSLVTSCNYVHQSYNFRID